MVLAAEHLVGDLGRWLVGGLHVAHDDHLALGDHHAVLGACVVGGALPAPAQGLDLQCVHPVRQLDEPRAAFEQVRAEVGQDAEREDVDLQLVDHLGELVDLVAGEELGLVADEVVDAAALGQLVDDVPPEVEVLSHLDGGVGQAEATGEQRLARPVARGEDATDPAAGGVVVVGLQRQCALARVHGPGEEVQFRHGVRSCHTPLTGERPRDPECGRMASWPLQRALS